MEKILGLRPGHFNDSSSTGAQANGLKEIDLNYDIYNYAKPKLQDDYGFEVVNKSGPLNSTITDYFNNNLPDNNYLLMSIHHDGNSNTSVNGSLVLASIYASQKTLNIASKMLELMCSKYNSNCRGIWQRESEKTPGKDYYYIIRYTLASVILSENLTITNAENANFIKSNYDNYIKVAGEIHIQIACLWYGINYNAPIISINQTEMEYLLERMKQLDSEYKILKNDVDKLKTLQDSDESIKEKLKSLL